MEITHGKDTAKVFPRINSLETFRNLEHSFIRLVNFVGEGLFVLSCGEHSFNQLDRFK